MTVLLDTHVLLWALLSPKRLSASARRLLVDPTTTALVSAASAWEVSTKSRLGKLPEAGEVVAGYVEHLRRLGAVELPIAARHGLLAGSFDVDDRDPFDRMIAAQSILEEVPVLSADPALGRFPCQVLW